MHKQREEDRISGALRKPSAEDEFDSRVRESEVREHKLREVSYLPVVQQVGSQPVRMERDH